MLVRRSTFVVVAMLVGCGSASKDDAIVAPPPPPSDVPAPEPPPASPTPPPPPPGPVIATIRIVSGNLSSGANQSYDPGEGIRIFRALAPDVALVQETNFGDGSDAAVRSFVDQAFGTSYDVHRETGASIPNAVVTRFPILAKGTWVDPGATGTRSFVWARIDLPGTREILAVSVHLKSSNKDAATRATEAQALADAIRAQATPGDALVIGGDLNTEDTGETCLATLSAIVDTSAPYPADSLGNSFTNQPRNAHYDWVLVDPMLRKSEVAPTLAGTTFPTGAVFDTRILTVAPALGGDSAAVGMQHMAVARDFALH
ncbi:MAG TPA: endonuclease/exonuclease/phosphatase family protein [Labilithrix sp.]|jgi:endonuclease/exonuclease/phosphatase family metal-dependent hydrolase